MVDRNRRDAIKSLAKGAIYTSPVVFTLAAPSRLLGQGPSDMMMFMFCDYFPTLCWIFDIEQENAPAAPGSQPDPGVQPDFPPPPGDVPPPGRDNPFR